MAETAGVTLQEPRIEGRPALHIAGLSGDFTRESVAEIPKLWDRFNAELGRLNDTAQWTRPTYGVVYPTPTMHYVAGIEVKRGEAVTDGWETAEVPAQSYAVFSGTGGLAAIPPMWTAIFSHWLPKSGRKVTGGPMIELYPPDWMQSGAFEIWVPLEP